MAVRVFRLRGAGLRVTEQRSLAIALAQYPALGYQWRNRVPGLGVEYRERSIFCAKVPSPSIYE